MSAESSRWHAGEHHVLVWDGGAALISSAVAASDAERIWNAMRRDASLAKFLETLAETQGTGLLDLPPFAVALVSDGAAHLAVRGTFTITSAGEGQNHEYSGETITTWFERRISNPERIVLSSADCEGDGLPIVAGVVKGAGIDVGGLQGTAAADGQVPLRQGSRDGVAPAASGVGGSMAPSASVLSADPDLEAESAPAPDASATPLDLGDPVGDEDLPEPGSDAPISEDPPLKVTEVEDDADLITVPKASDSSSNELGSDQPGGSAPVVASKYASLFGESIAVRPEVAAVRDGGGAGPPEAPPAHPSSPEASAVVQATPSEAGDAIPPSGASQPVIPDRDLNHDLHDGQTIVDFSELEKAMTSAAPEADPPIAAAPSIEAGAQAHLISASFCQRGHANPPHRDLCRVCKGPVEDRTELTPRPALGRLRLSSGETLDLTGTIVAGRSPTTVGHHGMQAPRLLALPHPHVSGNHLEFSLEGWSVMVRDLASRNGSYLRRSGQPPMRLPESAIPLANGDIIDLGHGVFIYLEQLP